jgi:hypothetical protein
MRKILTYSLLTAISFALSANVVNLRRASVPEKDSLFRSDSCLQLTISADFSKLLSNIENDTDIHSGKLYYIEKNGGKKEFDIKIRIRGRFRRSTENCDFPPLEIEFQPKQVKNSLFENQKKIKMVTHCRTRRSQYEQYLLEEYLIYKTYNLFTDLSYEVRLASVTYRDSKGKMDPFTRYAFFLENTTLLARRCDVERLRIKYVLARNTDSVHVNMLSVFQYLIGNTDWSIPALHNIVMVRKNPEGVLFAIPYDFEWSGIMNTEYARPQESLGIGSVRDRLFRGYCRSPEEFEQTFSKFRMNKENIYKIYNSQQGLENKKLKQTLKYIDEFFEIIDNPKLVKREFLEKCRQ